jgi:hypothetical protein
VAAAAVAADAFAQPPPCHIQGRKPFASTDAVTEAIRLALKNAVVDVGSTDSARRTFGCIYGLEQDGNPRYLLVPAPAWPPSRPCRPWPAAS